MLKQIKDAFAGVKAHEILIDVILIATGAFTMWASFVLAHAVVGN